MNRPDNVRRTRAENATFVIESVKMLDLKPHPESRLMRMHRVLTTADRVIEPHDEDFETALEADRDLQILSFVFDHAMQETVEPEFRSLVRTALKDSVLPQQDRAHSKGRDAQFELFVAAICHSAGMLPVALEEPDVTCTVNNQYFRRFMQLFGGGRRCGRAGKWGERPPQGVLTTLPREAQGAQNPTPTATTTVSHPAPMA